MIRDTTAISSRVAITMYCAIQSRELLEAWQHSGYDRYGWLILLLWTLPIFMPRLFAHQHAVTEKQTMIMMPVALLFTIVGLTGSLRVLQHVGLAIALAGWVPFSLIQGAWLVSAIAWMPAFGWIGSRLFSGYIFPARLLLAGTAVSIFIAAIRRKQRKKT